MIKFDNFIIRIFDKKINIGFVTIKTKNHCICIYPFMFLYNLFNDEKMKYILKFKRGVKIK